MNKLKLTPAERSWVLYDVGNSAFTLLIATIIPIYFNFLAEEAGLSNVQYLAYWGYAASAATLLVAVLGPVFGTLADTQGYKKPIFLLFLGVGLIGCIALGFAAHWLWFLLIFVVARVGYSGSLIFYDSMLSDITDADRMDHVSSQGYAWGYIGSCIPFAGCLALVLGAGALGLSMVTAMGLSFGITALWWLGFTLPLLRRYEQKHFVERQPHAIRESFARLGRTLASVRQEKKIFLFLLAFFFYIDGVYTIIDMATAYGEALGLDSTGLLLALLLTQVVAFPFAILFGRLARKFSGDQLIPLCILAYFGIAVFAMFLRTQAQFWMLAVLVGMFQGGIQALSRSYFARIIPSSQSGEYFGLLDICGKGASFMGTTVVSVVSQITGNISLGVGMIALLFLVGLILFRQASRIPS
ncbi:MFS transporter [Hydrogenoanaerobacterium saccharovorans]|uniref:MFS transporter n=1 Tax=Hydrogenoanaerobacterium saccharovorans TaxID=474960 RepID=A0ABS2GQF5_9FIRM|nr:MFS transporter [Hydrogenoanaerobacterium saccharovorans]MBM6923720.1 MFS transporter [Hydrogenoanaerobacterium saccharovorans]HIY80803.1 MFS transporter [Bacillota bacterium]